MDFVSGILQGKICSSALLPTLEKLVVENPYCSAYQMALSKILSNLQPEEYEARLGELSMYAPSRKWMWEFINQPISREEKSNEELSTLAQEINEPQVQEKNLQPQEIASQEKKESGDNEFFSETLARIYIKQMKYERAIKIFEKLSLKFPEKSVYFADQIRFLRIIIENNKK